MKWKLCADAAAVDLAAASGSTGEAAMAHLRDAAANIQQAIEELEDAAPEESE